MSSSFSMIAKSKWHLCLWYELKLNLVSAYLNLWNNFIWTHFLLHQRSIFVATTLLICISKFFFSEDVDLSICHPELIAQVWCLSRKFISNSHKAKPNMVHRVWSELDFKQTLLILTLSRLPTENRRRAVPYLLILTLCRLPTENRRRAVPYFQETIDNVMRKLFADTNEN